MATTSTPTTARRTIRLSLQSAGLSMTADEFDAWPMHDCDRRFRYELIRGVLVVTPPPGNGEVDPNQYLGYLLIGHQENHPQGRIVDKTLSEQTVPAGENRRRCDRAIWVGLGRVPNPEVDFPAIVVEFVSGSRRDFIRDYEEKRDEYRQAGAREYWIIDRFRRMMAVYRFTRGDAPPETVLTVAATGSYQTDLIPGFVLPLGRLLQAADDWVRPPRSRRKPQAKPPEGDPR